MKPEYSIPNHAQHSAGDKQQTPRTTARLAGAVEYMLFDKFLPLGLRYPRFPEPRHFETLLPPRAVQLVA
jgi:hypothetical protein